MSRRQPAIVLVSVALFAALIGHVTIDILGDYLLVHDTYDDLEHASRALVAGVTFGLALAGLLFALHAAIREARGSENAFCVALRRGLPKNTTAFAAAAVICSAAILCAMEGCDALFAGHAVDDVGDLFGGSISFGGSIIAVVALAVSTAVLAGLRRLARLRLLTAVVVAFLRRCCTRSGEPRNDLERRPRPVLCALRICRRIAGRAPPLLSRAIL